MKTFAVARICVVGLVGMLVACSSTRKDSAPAPGSDDLLELLTGFGESISKRNFTKAVSYMVPEERSLMIESDGKVPEDKQKMLMALPLQRLIRHSSIRVENGHIAGIYTLLPNLRHGEAGAALASDATEPGTGDYNDALSQPAEGTGEQSTGDSPMAAVTEDEENFSTTDVRTKGDPQLRAAVNKFFTALNRKNWSGALALMNEDERKFLLDEKGRLKESSKQRLSRIDQKNRDALVLQDGKLTGVTLLLPGSGD
jgi:hypothetical protein